MSGTVICMACCRSPVNLKRLALNPDFKKVRMSNQFTHVELLPTLACSSVYRAIVHGDGRCGIGGLQLVVAVQAEHAI